MREKPINVLLIDDNPEKTGLIPNIIRVSCDNILRLEHVDRLSERLECFDLREIEVILLDLGLPDDSSDIYTFIRVCSNVLKVPVIVLSDYEDLTLERCMMQARAQDYLVKDQIDSKLLVRSIRHAIERQKLISELQDPHDKNEMLHGLLPICASCKKIRDNRGFWNEIEEYIRAHSEADFTHSCCPECATKYYPEFTKSRISV